MKHWAGLGDINSSRKANDRAERSQCHDKKYGVTRKHEQREYTHEAKIYGEIAGRLIELHDGQSQFASPMGRTPMMWLMRAAKLAQDSPPAFWMYLRLQSGDTSDLSATYAELGAKTYRARTTVAIELAKTCALLAQHYPELAKTVNVLRARFRLPRGKDAVHPPDGYDTGAARNEGTPGRNLL